MLTMDNWRTRMSADMKLHDYRVRTQEGYMLAVRQFFDWVKREPAELTEDDVRAYFLYLRNDRKLAPSSINIAVCGLRFFVTHSLQREWPVFELLRVDKPRLLPVVLSTTEVRTILGAVRHPVRRMALTTICALGLRLGEGLRLETGTAPRRLPSTCSCPSQARGITTRQRYRRPIRPYAKRSASTRRRQFTH